MLLRDPYLYIVGVIASVSVSPDIRVSTLSVRNLPVFVCNTNNGVSNSGRPLRVILKDICRYRFEQSVAVARYHDLSQKTSAS
jgi:hypothetical protein